MRGYAKEGVPERIRAAGGEIYAITSEPRALASQAQQEWAFGFEAIGDPHHEISGACRDRGWLELFVNDKMGFLRASGDWQPQHPKGYFQPGVLAVASSGRVLYRWRGVPSRKNMGGAAERPTPGHVFASLSRALEAPSDAPDAPFDEAPPVDVRGLPWPLFVALLVANGWFVWPRGFPHRENGPSAQRRVLGAMARIVAFVSAWVAAFLWLPTLWAAAALVLWATWIARGIRFIHVEFQNETVLE